MPLLKPIRALQIDWSHPLTRGLAGCWLINEATGETVTDCGPRHNNGTFNYSSVAPVWKPGKYGSCLEFGTERCIDCGTGKFGWDLTNEVSVVALVNQNASQVNTLFARSGYVRPCRLSAYSSGRFKWWVYTDGTDCAINSTSTHATDGSECVHVAGIWRPGDGRLYVNGVQEAGESSSSGSLSFVNDSQPVGIGGTYEAGNYYYCWNGKIEYVFIYNRALSAEQVRCLFREPFAMFARPISPASIHISAATISLAGSVSSTSAGSAALTSTGIVPQVELNWQTEALFNGMTANALKLGTALTLGRFWIRIAGCSALYRGPSMEQIDFETVLAVAERDVCEISPPNYLTHDSNSTYIYVVRRYNHCGYQELTLAAAVKVSLDAEGELDKPQSNKVFAARAEQADADKVRLTWFYCPLEQGSQPACFNIYHDSRTGQIDYENPLAEISYKGRKFYSYESDPLEPGRYLFAIKAEDAAGIERNSSAHLSIEIDGTGPDAVTILQAETV
ncbi:MAG: LamG domain-containing protein [Sedimentisphaerales bacterium]